MMNIKDLKNILKVIVTPLKNKLERTNNNEHNQDKKPASCLLL